jgi:hypothetical protein
MPNYTESREYARDRLDRIVTRYQHHYSSAYFIRRACDSATRRMTNTNKLTAWATVLEAAGWDASADFARRRVTGLFDGSVTSQRRPRLGRTTVPAYVPVRNPLPPVAGVNMVTYNFTVVEDV